MTAPTNQHYDQDPDLFAYFLDETKKYSSALYQNGHETLDEAQQYKLRFIATELNAEPGKRFIDIGCGWGSLTLFLADMGCHVVGVTPADHQADYIEQLAEKRGLSSKVTIRRGQFEDLEFEKSSFDGASYVGSLVHFPDKARALARTHELIRLRGRVYFSESCFRSQTVFDEFSKRETNRFVLEDIFGAGALDPLSLYVRAFEEAGFSLIAMRDLTADYFKTIEAWGHQLQSNRDTLEARWPGIVERYQRYFDVANAGWGFTTKHYALTAARQR
ncbi:MAG: class I SAM-dependent methyltransferase [Myxococcota bacterium]